MDSKINVTRQEGFLYFLDKKTLTAQLRKGDVKESVALGFNNHHFHRKMGMMGSYLIGNPGGLS
jgi:hypothetical protein